jgi:hypothetical protein
MINLIGVARPPRSWYPESVIDRICMEDSRPSARKRQHAPSLPLEDLVKEMARKKGWKCRC